VHVVYPDLCVIVSGPGRAIHPGVATSCEDSLDSQCWFRILSGSNAIRLTLVMGRPVYAVSFDTLRSGNLCSWILAVITLLHRG